MNGIVKSWNNLAGGIAGGKDFHHDSNFKIDIDNSLNISDEDITEHDIKRIGHSVSISDKGTSALFENRRRREVISTFFYLFSKSGQGFYGGVDSNNDNKKMKSTGGERVQPEYVDAAYSIAKWSMGRFRKVISDIKNPANRFIMKPSLVKDLESLQWCITAIYEAEEAENNDGGEDDVDSNGSIVKNEALKKADMNVWRRFCIAVQGKTDDEAPDFETSDYEFDFGLVRDEAVEHFKNAVEKGFKDLSFDDLVSSMYLLTQFKAGPTVMEMILPIVIKRSGKKDLMDEILPKLLVLVIVQMSSKRSLAFLEIIFQEAKDFLTDDAVCSALEYCSHVQKLNCARFIIDTASQSITSEGLICAMIPVALRGADHYMAPLELFIMDISIQAEFGDTSSSSSSSNSSMGSSSSSELGGLGSFKSLNKVNQRNETPAEYMLYVAKASYLFIFLAAVGGYAKASSVKELIQFYLDPCAKHLSLCISEKQHKEFIQQTFYSVCGLNHSSIAWAMVEEGWVPHNINEELKLAIALGHQSIIHLLLESSLVADPKLEPSCLPIVFRKSEILSFLPKIAERFPKEAAWYLEQLSCIPLPACVPKGKYAESEVKPRPIKGMRLGALTLDDCVNHRKEAGRPSVKVWPNLKVNAQLKRAGSGKDDFEMESTVCLCPEALLKGTAHHEPLFGDHWTPATSPFIRLIAENDPQITLQPIIRALIEYHWSHGHFWMRFGVVFVITVFYVICLMILFIVLVQKQNGADGDMGLKSSSLLYPFAVFVLILATFQMIQELREFNDYPRKYLKNLSNLVDSVTHGIAIFVVIAGVFMGIYIPPIVMSFTLILCGWKVILLLQILPSIGPLVRLIVTAGANITPILIPFIVLIVSFAVGFYLEEAAIAHETGIPAIHFSDLSKSLQSVLIMVTTDYSVIDNPLNPYIFLIRIAFHMCFIIFLVNIIIALMTVNVADIHANTTAAWFMQVSGLMVGLELFWPVPHRYNQSLAPPSSPNPNLSQMTSNSNLNSKESIQHDSDHFKKLLNEKCAVIYTWPLEFVMNSPWWSFMIAKAIESKEDADEEDDDKEYKKAVKNNDDEDDFILTEELDKKDHHGWNMGAIMKKMGLGQRANSTPALPVMLELEVTEPDTEPQDSVAGKDREPDIPTPKHRGSKASVILNSLTVKRVGRTSTTMKQVEEREELNPFDDSKAIVEETSIEIVSDTKKAASSEQIKLIPSTNSQKSSPDVPKPTGSLVVLNQMPPRSLSKQDLKESSLHPTNASNVNNNAKSQNSQMMVRTSSAMALTVSNNGGGGNNHMHGSMRNVHNSGANLFLNPASSTLSVAGGGGGGGQSSRKGSVTPQIVAPPSVVSHNNNRGSFIVTPPVNSHARPSFSATLNPDIPGNNNASHRPSLWQQMTRSQNPEDISNARLGKLSAAGSGQVPMITHTEAPVINIAGPSTVVKQDPTISKELESILEAVRGMDRFIKIEAKISRDRIKRLEDNIGEDYKQEAKDIKKNLDEIRKHLGMADFVYKPKQNHRESSVTSSGRYPTAKSKDPTRASISSTDQSSTTSLSTDISSSQPNGYQKQSVKDSLPEARDSLRSLDSKKSTSSGSKSGVMKNRKITPDV